MPPSLEPREDGCLAVEPLRHSPAWFQDAVARPWRPLHLEVQGGGVYARLYESAPQGAPGLVLVHGGSAHSHWWSFVAGQLDGEYRVLCVDLPGMGESDHRPAYSARLTADCIAALCRAAGMACKAEGGEGLYICGHSFGGFMTLSAAHFHPGLADGIVVVDSPVTPPGSEFGGPAPAPNRVYKHYQDLDEILGRFRLQPPQECDKDYVMDFIARHSVRRTAEGWRWKFDPNQYALMRASEKNRVQSRDMLPGLRCRLHYVYGELSSLFPAVIADYTREQVAATGGGVSVLPGVHHHLFLEDPQGFAAELREVLRGWTG